MSHRARRAGLAVLCLFVLVSGIARAGAPSEEIVSEVWKAIAEHYHDPNFGGRDWDEIGRRYRALAAAEQGDGDPHRIANEMLSELGASHLGVITREAYLRSIHAESKDRRVARLGLELEEVAGEFYVSSLLEGGPAERAGILVGDEVATLDGVPARVSPRLVDAPHDVGVPHRRTYDVRAAEQERVALEVRSEADGETRAATLAAVRTNDIAGCERSVRIVERDGAAIGVIHFPHFLHPRIVSIFERALEGPLADAQALVLDIRGRGGQAAITFRLLGMLRGEDAVWHRPVVVLIDRETRSAKEIFAWHFKRSGRGPIVGERTQGAVLGCRFTELADGSYLMLPVQDVRAITQGISLEGEGVGPTVPVAQAPLPFRGGRDAILERGLEVALEELGVATPAGRRTYR